MEADTNLAVIKVSQRQQREIFDRSDSLTFADTVSGAGSVTKRGAGTLTLTGTNTFSGGTTISAGTMQVGNGGTTGTLNNTGVGVSVSLAGTMAFDRSNWAAAAGP